MFRKQDHGAAVKGVLKRDVIGYDLNLNKSLMPCGERILTGTRVDAGRNVSNPQRIENGLDKGDTQECGEKWLGLECILRNV